MKKMLIAVMVLCLTGISAAHGSDPGPIEKLNTGLWNIMTSPGEIFMSVKKDRAGKGLLAGTSHGLLEGLSRFVVKGVTGVVEVGTFLIPWPNGYSPILDTDPSFSD